MTIYEENLAYLQEQAPEIYRMLIADKALFGCELQPLMDEFNFQLIRDDQRCFLHSIYDKEKELDLMFAKTEKDVEVLLLFGLGCGYVLDYLRKNFPKIKRLIIIEPALEVFREFLKEKEYWRSFFGLGKVSFWVNKEEQFLANMLAVMVQNNIRKKFDFISTYSYTVLFEQYYQKVQDIFANALRVRRLNLTTLVHATYQFLENIMNNIRCVDVFSDQIRAYFSNKPVILISAGPSLNKQLPYLPLLKERAILIAVGSAIVVLDHHGIIPHFRVSIDFNKATKENIMIDSLQEKEKVPLFYANQIYRDTITSYAGLKILLHLDVDQVSSYIYQKMGLKLSSISSGTSVANIIFAFLCTTDCREIIFLGQDMCLYEDKLHASGAVTTSMNNVAVRDRIATKDIYGNDVWSQSNYFIIKTSYESYIKSHRIKPSLFNATEGGLGIDGVPNISLQEILENHLTEPLKCEDFHAYLQENKTAPLHELTVWEEIRQEAVQVFDLIEEQIKVLQKIDRNRNKKMSQNRVLNDLIYLEKNEEQLNEKEFYQKVVRRSLAGFFFELELYYHEEGINDKEKIEIKKNILVNKLAEAEKFTSLFIGYVDNIIANLELQL